MTTIIPGIRNGNGGGTSTRKRDNAVALVQMAPPPGAVAGDDCSSAGSSALDSMRVAMPRKKRRRTILDAFSNLQVTNNNSNKQGEVGEGNFVSPFGSSAHSSNNCCDNDGDADSSQAVADAACSTEDVHCYSTSSSLEEDRDDDDLDRMLSDKEEVERKVMLELVFGPNSGLRATTPSGGSTITTAAFVGSRPKQDPVDRKLQKMIRKSLQQATAYMNGQNNNTQQQPTTQDDMNIEPSYSRPSSSSTTTASTAAISRAQAAGGAPASGTGTTTMSQNFAFAAVPTHRKSNSLPEMNFDFAPTAAAEDSMDLSQS